VYLDHDVRFKAAFEKRLRVTTSRRVTGSWGWIDDRTVAYRPKRFWPGHTRVTVHLDVGKTQTAPGRWVKTDRTISFRVGRSQVLRIRNSTKRLTVTRAGRLVRTIPVSMGKPGFTTRSGVKVIMTRERVRYMDSDTVGIGGADAYALEVPYAMRMTATGEFLHGAPWSEWAQGSANVSHGCTNASLANGAWLYAHTLIGDPVITTGTGRATETWNGLGGIWNYSWAEWQTRSARR
jgi:lipoprotein-anchoring transpeptidase ErfK/SrfK